MPDVKILPSTDRVLVEPIEVKNETKSGLVISAGGESTIKTSFATILAKNESVENYNVGDVVFYNPNAGFKTRLFGKNYVLLTRGEILAKIEIENKEDINEAFNPQDLA